MFRIVLKMLTRLVLFAPILILAGCIEADQPLFGSERLITPLKPGVYQSQTLVGDRWQDDNGGKVVVRKTGSTYTLGSVDPNQSGSASLRIYPYKGAFSIIEFIDPQRPQSVIYMLVEVSNTNVKIYDDSCTTSTVPTCHPTSASGVKQLLDLQMGHPKLIGRYLKIS